MPGFPQDGFYQFLSFPINELYITGYCWYAMQFFKLKIGHFEYCNVVILEIRFSLLPRVWCCNLLRTTVIILSNDFSKLFLQRLYSLSYVITEVSVLLSQQSSNDLTEISLDAGGKNNEKTKQNRKPHSPTLLVSVDWLWARAFFWCFARSPMTLS